MAVQTESTTALTEDTSCLKKVSINKILLPMKLHYFLFYGAVGAVMPFMPLVGKELGINATAVGLVFTVLPFVVIFSKPGFGAITDHFGNFRLVMYILVLVTTASFLCVIYIPPIENQTPPNDNVTLQCLTESVVISVPSNYDEDCVIKIMSKGSTCGLHLLRCGDAKDSEYADKCQECRSYSQVNLSTYHVNTTKDFDNSSSNAFQSRALNGSASPVHFLTTQSAMDTKQCNGTHHCGGDENIPAVYTPKIVNDNLFFKTDIEFYHNLTSMDICKCPGTLYALQCNPVLQSCSKGASEDDLTKVYKTYQFWVFSLLAVISGTGSASLFSLSDSACMELLKDRTQFYGRQRLWATISWGLNTFFAGYLNDLASSAYKTTTYAPGFYLMVVFVVLDLIALHWIAPSQSSFSTSIFKDVGRIFKSCEIICISVAVTLIGIFSGLLWSYQLWYLQDLGANQTLLGLTIAVQCLVAEVPMFFLSGRIIRRFGHMYCMIGSFAAFCLRYTLYFFLKDPWFVLPIEILHGQTFAIFYASMTSYAKTRAPAGTEATMMGVLGGLFEGLGLALGNILSGVSYDQLGGRYTFLTAGIVSGICTVVFLFLKLVFLRKTK